MCDEVCDMTHRFQAWVLGNVRWPGDVVTRRSCRGLCFATCWLSSLCYAQQCSWGNLSPLLLLILCQEKSASTPAFAFVYKRPSCYCSYGIAFILVLLWKLSHRFDDFSSNCRLLSFHNRIVSCFITVPLPPSGGVLVLARSAPAVLENISKDCKAYSLTNNSSIRVISSFCPLKHKVFSVFITLMSNPDWRCLLSSSQPAPLCYPRKPEDEGEVG